jgi:hypothetical protein
MEVMVMWKEPTAGGPWRGKKQKVQASIIIEEIKHPGMLRTVSLSSAQARRLLATFACINQ